MPGFSVNKFGLYFLFLGCAVISTGCGMVLHPKLVDNSLAGMVATTSANGTAYYTPPDETNYHAEMSNPSPAKALKPSKITVTLTNGNKISRAVGNQIVLSLAMPDMAMPEQTLTCSKTSSGAYQGTTTFPMSGKWTISGCIVLPTGYASHIIRTVQIK